MTYRFLAAMLSASTAAIAFQVPAAGAQASPPTQGDRQSYDIAAQDLDTALRQYARISGREVIASSQIVAGKRGARVEGRLPADAALTRLLAGTGLVAERIDGALVIREGKEMADVAASTDGRGDAIVVTGTRIRGAGPVGSPLEVVDRDALDRSGRATLADYIQTIPQNFSGGPGEANVGTTARSGAASNLSFGSTINLRGLGPGSTLTLFDGARPALGGGSGAFADLSLVPSAAIDRIEILTDGASAIYGSDAVAGVVNLRFRNRFKGMETRIRAGAADGDYGEYQLGQIVGAGWSRGHIIIAGEYYRRGNLASTQRDFATEDLRRFGGPDLRSNYDNPGTIVAANGQRFPIPRGQDGTGLTPAMLVAGDFRRGDARRHIDILPRQETLSVYASAEQEVGDLITLFARGFYAERRFEARQRVFGPSPITVTSANPFYVDPIGTGQPITVYYDPTADFGAETARGKVRALNASAGARAALGPWSIEIGGGYGRQREASDVINVVNRLRLSRAVTGTSSAGAINLFGDGGVNSAALIDSLRGGLDRRVGYDVRTASLRADGPLVRLPAGEVKMALGAEYRRDRLRFRQILDFTTDVPLILGIPGLPDKRIVRALYAEVAVPIFDAGSTFPGALTLSAAGRYEDYSDVGDTANPKFGARWTPLPGVALRSSFGRSFRAPNFDQLVGSANALYQVLRLPDPQSPTGQSIVLGLFGFRPELGPEKAESWTAGLDVEPGFIAGARLSATWFRVGYRDRIASANSDLQNFLRRRDVYGGLIEETPDPAVVAAYFAGPSFSNLLGATPAQVVAIVDGRTRNLSRATVSGIDIDLAYNRPLGDGSLGLSIGGTRLLGFDSQITDSAPSADVLGTLGNPVRLRLRGRAGLTLGAFDGGIGFNHVAGYRNLTVTPAERVASWTTFDLQLGARVAAPGTKSLRLALSVNNIFDTDPPYVQFRTTGSAFGYDPEQASAIGRTVALQAILSW